MDLVSRLNEGSKLVEKDAEALLSGKSVETAYLTNAAQRAVEKVLAQNESVSLGVLTGDSVKEHLTTVSPANA